MDDVIHERTLRTFHERTLRTFQVRECVRRMGKARSCAALSCAGWLVGWQAAHLYPPLCCVVHANARVGGGA